MNRIVLFLSLALVLILTNTVFSTEIKVVRFAISGTHAPFAKLHSGKELRGFDVDLAKEICKRMNFQCTFTHDKMSNMITSLQSDKYDAWISAITITEERKKAVAFSHIYFSGSAKLLATKATTFNAAPIEIKGKTIGVEADTSYIPYVQEIYGDTVKIRFFSSDQESCRALKEGRVDAVIDDETVLKQWRLEQPDSKQYRLISLPAKHLNLIKQEYAIAIAKRNVALVTAINQALAKIKSDGTHDVLVKKHFERGL